MTENITYLIQDNELSKHANEIRKCKKNKVCGTSCPQFLHFPDDCAVWSLQNHFINRMEQENQITWPIIVSEEQ